MQTQKDSKIIQDLVAFRKENKKHVTAEEVAKKLAVSKSLVYACWYGRRENIEVLMCTEEIIQKKLLQDREKIKKHQERMNERYEKMK